MAQGHLEKRYKGSWTCVVDLGRDPVTGKRVRKARSVKGSKKQAEDVLKSMLAEAHYGRLGMAPENVTLGDYLRHWLSQKEADLKSKTYESYEGIIRTRILPELGNAKLVQLRPVHLNDFYLRLRQSPRLDGKDGPISVTTIRYVHSILRAALNDAVKAQLLSENPVKFAIPPRRPITEAEYFDKTEAAELVKAVDGERYGPEIQTAILTGLRIGELLGLTWSNVNLKEGYLEVRQTAAVTKKDGLHLAPPKTKKSIRKIVLSSEHVSILRRHKAAQSEHRLSLGSAWQKNGLLFPTPEGKLMHPSTLSHGYKRLLRRLGFRELPFHALRHTHATLLLRRGVHPKVVQERLGHTSIIVTLDTYSHVIPSLQETAAAQLDDMFV